MMSYHVSLPIQVHFEQVLHIFGYLKKHHNSEMVFDPTKPDIDMSQFENKYLSQNINVKLAEDMHPNAPPACGRGM